jgi:CIC family chloride channel protein
LIALAAAKMIACGLTIGIGGSGGVFALSLVIGVTSGMAFDEIAHHLLGPATRQPALADRHGHVPCLCPDLGPDDVAGL